jgi:protein TonB
MFSSLQLDSNSNPFLTFSISLFLQIAVLLVMMVGGGRYSQMRGPSLRSQQDRSAVTPIYFQPDMPAALSTPEAAPAPAQPAPEVASKAHAEVEEASNTQTETDSASGEGQVEGQGLAPFASWSMNSNSRGVTMFHHQFKTALPVFTPDPPILRARFPEPARGKDIVIQIVINDQGAIQQATVLQGIGYGVEESIMQTLRQWIFVPAKVNGMPIASQRQLRFHFPG